MDRVKLVCELKVVVGHPSEREYKDRVSNKLLPNFPITTKYISNEKYIFVLDFSGMRGNTVRHNPIIVHTY